MPSLHRYGILPVEEVVKALRAREKFFYFQDMKVPITSTRILTYSKGTTCVSCGKEGAYFAVEEYIPKDKGLKKIAHFNLYTETGLLMTSDHILPKSLGGSDSDLNNRQCMCAPCNNKKGNTFGDGKLNREHLLRTLTRLEALAKERKNSWNRAIEAKKKALLGNHYHSILGEIQALNKRLEIFDEQRT